MAHRTPEELRAFTNELGVSVWTAAALGALFESGLVEHLREPRTLDDLAARCRGLTRGQVERCLAVAAAAGVVAAEGPGHRLAEGAMPFAQLPMRGALAGDLRTTLMQAVALLDSSRGAAPVPGWRHVDPALLQSQGDASSGLAPLMKARIVPALGDLAQRLEQPGARFLDIGVGVAALAVAMCRAFPQLRVVGVDPSDAPLAIARENVARAGLGERIELRQGRIEDLGDDGAFDLAWLPSFFVPAPALASAVAATHAALRPGGWIMFAVGAITGEDRQVAVRALVNELWGGVALSGPEGEAALREGGFSSVRALPGPPWAGTMVVGQR